MCGIVGFYTQSEINTSGTIESMMKSIQHRGPDGYGTYFDNKLTLGHRRLSIIDIENGAQPMKSSNENLVIVFNGEIYNYLELRQQLIAKGCAFNTFSDTEVLLNMYQEFGEDCLNYLNGMFAFVIYDKAEDILFVARDHFGIKPFYYFLDDEKFVFASEIKALLEYPGIDAIADEFSLNEYVTFQMTLKKHTMFKDIHKLPPASFMVLRNGKIESKGEYWNFDFRIDDSKSEEEYQRELLVLLENSLSIQIRSDVPVGAYLSGGLDSSIVATLASKSYISNIHTFTGGFHLSADYDETKYARCVSDHIHSIHHEIFPEHTDFLKVFEKLVYHMDEPGGGPGLFPQFMVSKMASEHVKVVLGGQGGDEVFGGYARYAVAYLEQCLKGAIFETQEEGNHLVTLHSIINNLPILKKYVPMMRSQFSEGLFDTMESRYFRLINRSLRLHEIYSQEFLNSHSQEVLFDKYLQVFNNPDTKSYFNKMTHYDLKTLLPTLLQIEDRVSMAVSLESRVPLLDKRIVELAAKMPPSFKFAGGKTKYMLLQSVRNILPAQVVNRKDKMGFPTPLNEWIAGPLKEYALDILLSQKARNRGFSDPSKVENALHKNNKFNRDMWGLLNLEVWYNTFIDK